MSEIFIALLAFVVWFGIIVGATTIQAQSGGTYDLTWNTLDGGGGTSSGGTFTLSGTIGQADAGEMTGAAWTLNGGFWQNAPQPPTPTPTPTQTATSTTTATQSPTSTTTATQSPTSTQTFTPSSSGTATFTPTATETATSVASSTPTSTALNCANKPPKPQLIVPTDGKMVKKVKVLLDWSDADCADSYRVMVRLGSPKGTRVEKKKNLSESAYKTKALNRGETYYWRASACNSFGCAKSGWRNFSIKP